MAYFEDLSPYCYLKRASSDKVLNVGWLAKGVPFATGSVSQEIIDTLLKQPRVHQTRGFHRCEFCGKVDAVLGSAEIWIKGEIFTYASPDLITHYIRDHGYAPPEEFIHAVLRLESRS